MSTETTSFAADGVSLKQRMEALFEELAELSGHRNAIDGRIVDIDAEIDRDGLAGNTGYRSIASMVAECWAPAPQTPEPRSRLKCRNAN